MAKVNDTLGVWAKKGYVMVGDKLVKSGELVTKGKVEKIEPEGFNPFMIPGLSPIEHFSRLTNPRPVNDLSIAMGVAILAKQRLDAFNETGILFTEAYPEDVFLLPTGELLKIKYRFNINPVSAPRMSQSDKWKTDPNHVDPLKRQRKPVEQYFRFKNTLIGLCAENGYKLTETLNILFIVPFPKSYNQKKREQLLNQPHDQKPDIDNFSKSWMDSLSKNDRTVWNLHAIKLWGEVGQIIIF